MGIKVAIIESVGPEELYEDIREGDGLMQGIYFVEHKDQPKRGINRIVEQMNRQELRMLMEVV
jgi:hypothetical protein